MTRKKKEKKRHISVTFQPIHVMRYGVKISQTPNDLKALGDRQTLNTQLLDCLLQRSAPPPITETRFQDGYKTVYQCVCEVLAWLAINCVILKVEKIMSVIVKT
jgi:hypothetical protein